MQSVFFLFSRGFDSLLLRQRKSQLPPRELAFLLLVAVFFEVEMNFKMSDVKLEKPQKKTKT